MGGRRGEGELGSPQRIRKSSRILAGGASANWGGRRDADIPSLLSLLSWQETWADAGRRLATNRQFCRANLKLRQKALGILSSTEESLVPRKIGTCWPLLANQIEGQTNECLGLMNLKHSSTYFHCDQESHLVVDVSLS